MCLAVYLGASAPLPLLEWDPERRGFHVVDVADDEQDRAVRVLLGTPFVYRAGSSDGCGCGFQFKEDPDWAAGSAEYETEEATLRSFRDYFADALVRLPEVRVFACWEGESDKRPLVHRRLTPDDLLHDDFSFVEGERSEFVPSSVAP
jgi:hypothetical protein